MKAFRHVEHRRTCLAYSPGGHLAELERALEGIDFTDCFHVTYGAGRPSTLPTHRHYRLCHPRRSVLRTIANAIGALLILFREWPRLVVSTGADVAVPIVLLSKLVGARIVYIETAAALDGSLSGRLVYPVADLFIVQWPDQLKIYPRAVLAEGPLL